MIGGKRQKGKSAGNYTYSLLRKSIERLIANDRQAKNLADRQNALRQAASGKAVADLAANQAAPAHKAKEKEKNKGQGDRSGSAKRSTSPTDKKAGKGKGKLHADKCYFYNVEIRNLGSGCRRGKEGKGCPRAHVRILVKKFVPPPKGSISPRRSSSPSSSGSEKKPKKKGRDRSASRDKKRKGVTHCFQFAREGKCDVKAKGGTCKYPHLTREEVDKAAKAKGQRS